MRFFNLRYQWAISVNHFKPPIINVTHRSFAVFHPIMYVTHRSSAAPAPATREFFWLYHTYSLLRGGFYNASSGFNPAGVKTFKISGPNRSTKVTDRFRSISVNVIYCIICMLCKKIYIGETGRKLADRFCERLRDVEKNDTDASKPVARHFNLPNHSHHNMTICALSLHHGNIESRKNLEQKFIFQLGTLSTHGINDRITLH